MKRGPWLKHFLFDCGTRNAVASNGLAALRLAAGLMMFFGHGLGKLQGFADKKDSFQVPAVLPFSLMSPAVSLSVAVVAEVFAALLLVLGLMTRPAAFTLAMVMVVAAFGIHGGDPFAARESALLYLFLCVPLVLSGAGAWSLDALVYRERRPRYL